MVTIIIPTFQPDDYLFSCLESLRNQVCLTPFEIIIVLNGPKEPYFKKIEEFIFELNLNKQCRLYHIMKNGVSLARNFGLSLVTNPYVLFIDDDDIISSNYVSNLLKGISSNYTLSICNTRTFTSSLNLAEPDYLSRKFINLENGKINLFNARSFFSVVWGKMIPMSIIGTTRFNTNFINGEDAFFMATISQNVKEITFTDDNVFYYRRIRIDSASQKKRSFFNKIKNSIKLFFLYLFVYIKHPFKYNFMFFISRFVAVFKTLFVKDF